MAAGFEILVQITLCYAGLITPALQQQWYSIGKEETILKSSYTISYNDMPVSVCRLEKDKGVVSLVVLGK